MYLFESGWLTWKLFKCFYLRMMKLWDSGRWCGAKLCKHLCVVQWQRHTQTGCKLNPHLLPVFVFQIPKSVRPKIFWIICKYIITWQRVTKNKHQPVWWSFCSLKGFVLVLTVLNIYNVRLYIYISTDLISPGFVFDLSMHFFLTFIFFYTTKAASVLFSVVILCLVELYGWTFNPPSSTAHGLYAVTHVPRAHY